MDRMTPQMFTADRPQTMDPAELQKALGDFQLPPELTKRLGK